MQTESGAGDQMSSLVEFYGEPISVYTMAQGIADGVLKEAGELAEELFPWPVMLTAAAWVDCVAWTEEDSERTGAFGQSETGRLWDVLWMTFCAIKRAKPTSFDEQVPVQLLRVDKNGKRAEEPEAEMVSLNAQFGAHDDGSVVLIIGQPGED